MTLCIEKCSRMSDAPDLDPTAPLVTQGAPKWVKVLGVIALVIVIGALIVMLTGGAAGHGPGRHGSSGPLGLHQRVA